MNKMQPMQPMQPFFNNFYFVVSTCDTYATFLKEILAFARATCNLVQPFSLKLIKKVIDYRALRK